MMKAGDVVTFRYLSAPPETHERLWVIGEIRGEVAQLDCFVADQLVRVMAPVSSLVVMDDVFYKTREG